MQRRFASARGPDSVAWRMANGDTLEGVTEQWCENTDIGEPSEQWYQADDGECVPTAADDEADHHEDAPDDDAQNPTAPRRHELYELHDASSGQLSIGRINLCYEAYERAWCEHIP